MPSEVFQFHYVTAPTGELSGHSFMVQTEDAINAIGQYAYESTADASEALRIAQQAQATAETASNNASSAVTTANSALTQVRTLQTTVESWNSRIQTAESNAATAVSTANAAVATAGEAVNTANSALTNSTSAVSTANSALETSNAASLSATQAVQTANTANDTAQNALNVAQQARIDAEADIATMQQLVQEATDQATESKTAAQNSAQSASESSDFSDLSKKWATKVENTAAEGEEADYTVDGAGFSAKWNANLAQDWAVKMDGMITDDGTPEGTEVDYSSKYYAQQAAQSASSASSSASAASASETNAASSASAAANSAGQASSSATNAADSASSASGSATAAQQAKTAAEAARDLAQEYAEANQYGVQYVAQTLTAEQQTQARANIAALGSDGTAAAAQKWSTARTFTVNGDASGSVSIDGSQDVSINLTVNSSTKATNDALGRKIDETYATQSDVETAIGGVQGCPTGMIAFFHATTPPDGWLPCNGQNVSRTTYANLFSVIGTTYGSGDGSTTFALPNLHHRFLEGTTTASEVGDYIEAGLPNITSSNTQSSEIGGWSNSNNSQSRGAFSSVGLGYGPRSQSSYRDGFHIMISLDASGSSSVFGGASTVQPASLRVLPCIRT